MTAATTTETSTGIYPVKTPCPAALNIEGEHFPCELDIEHDGWAHQSRRAEAIWSGSTIVDGEAPA